MAKGIPKFERVLEKPNFIYILIFIVIIVTASLLEPVIGGVVLATIALIIPGYCLLYAVFADVENDMDSIEVLALSLVLSIVLLVFFAFILSIFDLFDRPGLAISVVISSALFLFIGNRRESRLTE